MTADAGQSHDAQTTPVGKQTNCPQCGVQLDSFTTTCGACGAVVTGGSMDAERAQRVRVRLQQGIGAGYKLGEMLGRGGMGIVFQARELALDRDVALKVLAFDPLLNPDAYARFEREAKLAARLDHPNIVPIFSVGQGIGIAFYTMRLVRGGSVEGLVAGGRALDVGDALPILRDVAAALDYAHAQGVVHRDIKPANVLLGDSGHALVGDFGIARAFAGPASSGAAATGTAVMGSPPYMSPEQWRGENVDGRADQYALGVLAFELLAGQRPFGGASMQELLRMHLQEAAPDIIAVRHDLPSHLTDAIRRAMSKDPAARFASVAAFVAALGGTALPASTPRVVPVPVSSAPTIRTTQPGAAPAKTAARSPAPVRQGPALLPVPAAVAVADRDGKRRSLVPWLVLLLIATAAAAVISKLPSGSGASDATPLANTSVAAPADSVNRDSIAEIERAFQVQVTEARRIAMEAERRADQLAAGSRKSGAPVAAGSRKSGAPVAAGSRKSGAPVAAGSRKSGAPVAAVPRTLAHAHLFVFAQGGTPQVVIDGTGRKEAAPAVFQMVPGRHTVSVRGNQQFFPRDTTIELAAEDTQTVVFRSLPSEKQNGQARPAPPAGAASGGAGNDTVGSAPTVVPQINWPDFVKKLGFDPRTVDVRRLTSKQKQRYRRFQLMIDSLRRASPPRP